MFESEGERKRGFLLSLRKIETFSISFYVFLPPCRGLLIINLAGPKLLSKVTREIEVKAMRGDLRIKSFVPGTLPQLCPTHLAGRPSEDWHESRELKEDQQRG